MSIIYVLIPLAIILVAVALGIVLQLSRRFDSLDVDAANEMHS